VVSGSKMKNICKLLTSVLLCFNLSVVADSSTNDGPYVFEKENIREAIWVCQGKKMTLAVSLKTPQTITQCGMQATLWQAGSNETSQLAFDGDFKVAAASDIHGQFDLFIKLLKNNRIIDNKQQWNFANGHFVITGDIFDRGPDVTRALWFLYNLEKQAELAGGKVHLLLGNHEVMVLNGDLRYLHEKYLDTAKILALPFESLFSQTSILGKWLRSRPVLVKVNHMLFAHGGFHPQLADDNLSINQINQSFKSHLIKSELKEARKGLAEYLHKSNGPIWYRGYFNQNGASTLEVEQLLSHFQVTNIIVGHTTQETIETRYNGKVIAIDARMKAGSNGEILFWENGAFERGLLSGERVKLD
jgi:hypothetical protein